MNHRFVLKTRGPRHFWWDINDHLAAIMEHAPVGPWADVPASLGEAVRHVVRSAFGDKRFTLAQIFSGDSLLALPALQWAPPEADDTIGQALYKRQVARHGPPVAHNPRHAGRLVAEALRAGGWRVWAEDGVVKCQHRPGDATSCSDTQDHRTVLPASSTAT